jgi:hypothetical protein
VDAVVFFPSTLLALILLSIYVVKCLRRALVFNLGVLVIVAISSSGVIGGGMLALRPFLSAAFKARLTGLDWYIWLGGLAVLAVSIQVIYREIFPNRQRPTDNK